MSWGLRATASSLQLGAGSPARGVACRAGTRGEGASPLSPRVCVDSPADECGCQRL